MKELMNRIWLEENEVVQLRNILANIYMDSLGHNDVIAAEAKYGLDLTIRILEEYNGEDAGTI